MERIITISKLNKMKVEDVLKILHDNHVTPADLAQLVSPGVVQILDNLTRSDLELDAFMNILKLTKIDTINDCDWDYKIADVLSAVDGAIEEWRPNQK